MGTRGESFRFYLPVLLLACIFGYTSFKLVRAHLDSEISAPHYEFERTEPARRGSIYAVRGKDSPLVKSVPYWEYRLDPVALTNGLFRKRGRQPLTREGILKTISESLGIDSAKLERMAENSANRYQFLACSKDAEVHKTLADSSIVRGIAIHDCYVRQYLNKRMLSHVLGAINREGVGSAGLEQKYNTQLSGSDGIVRGRRDALGHELYDRRTISIASKPGVDIYLTIDLNLQAETEDALKWGIAEYGAASGWGIVMDAKTGAILAMASYPDFDPAFFGRASDEAKINRTVAFNFEPGSVMKVLTAAAAIDSNPKKYGPRTVYRTNRDDPNYYRLPGDGGHIWEPTMTLKDAIVHSSNIVIGKLAYDLGPATLYEYFKRFGFGARTGIELPGEEYGILPNPHRRAWDLASRSRAGIGQFVAVTPIQLISAYQAIANDGVRMKPYIINRIVDADGTALVDAEPREISRPISARTARTLRSMMLEVASPKGTARRAAIRGYTIAGKTGTAQKQIPGGRGYAPGLYRASFCGIVPATAPRVVILMTLDFEKRTLYHQGGNSAGPVFKRVALAATRYLSIPPDRPEDYAEYSSEDEFERILNERSQKYGIIND